MTRSPSPNPATAPKPTAPKCWWAVWDDTTKEPRSFFRDRDLAVIQANVDKARTGHDIRAAYWNYGARRLDGT